MAKLADKVITRFTYPITHVTGSFLKLALKFFSNSTGKFIHQKLSLKILF